MPVPLRSEFSADAVAALPGPPWLRALRQASWERFSGSDLPREQEEIWRYSRIDELDLDSYIPCPPGTEMSVEDLPEELQRLVDATGPGATVVVSHNGGEGAVLRPQPGLEVAPAGRGLLGNRAEPGPSGRGRELTFGWPSTAPSSRSPGESRSLRT